MRKSVIYCTWLAFMLTFVGCGSSALTIYVESEPTVNSGRPFYMLVRAVEQKDYVSEDYQTVAGRVFATADKNMLKTEVVLPGREMEVSVAREETLPVAIYFLFTTPGERWKVLLEQPLPDSVEFTLDAHQIKGQK